MQAKIRYRRAPDPHEGWPRVLKRMAGQALEQRPTLTVVLLPAVVLAVVLAVVMLLPISPPTSTAQTPREAGPSKAAIKPALPTVPQPARPANRMHQPMTLPALERHPLTEPQGLFKPAPATALPAQRQSASPPARPAFGASLSSRPGSVNFLPQEKLHRPAPIAKAPARASQSPASANPRVQVLADSTQRYHRVAYLVDLSGSLVDAMPQVIAWLGHSLDELEQPVSFTVIFFRNDAVVEVPPLGLKPGSFRAKYEVFNWMQLDQGHVRTGGKADLADAMIATMRYDLDEVFIISDDGFGTDSRWGTDPNLLDRIARILPTDQTRINTVQFYYRDPAGALEAIADRFGGTYTYEGKTHYPTPGFVKEYSKRSASAWH